MNGKAHLMAGLTTGAIYATVVGVNCTQYTQMPTLFKIVSAVSIGAWLPDIDIKHSSINNLLKRIVAVVPFLFLAIKFFDYKVTLNTAIIFTMTILIFKFSKHRSITHSLIGLAISLCVIHLLGITDFKYIICPFVLGIISHILLDMLTPEGVELLFPIRKHIGIFNL